MTERLQVCDPLPQSQTELRTCQCSGHWSARASVCSASLWSRRVTSTPRCSDGRGAVGRLHLFNKQHWWWNLLEPSDGNHMNRKPTHWARVFRFCTVSMPWTCKCANIGQRKLAIVSVKVHSRFRSKSRHEKVFKSKMSKLKQLTLW